MTDVDLTTAYATIGYPGRMASFFGRLQYEYDNRYLMTASIRRDGSSKFGKISVGVFSLPYRWLTVFRTNGSGRKISSLIQ